MTVCHEVGERPLILPQNERVFSGRLFVLKGHDSQAAEKLSWDNSWRGAALSCAVHADASCQVTTLVVPQTLKIGMDFSLCAFDPDRSMDFFRGKTLVERFLEGRSFSCAVQLFYFCHHEATSVAEDLLLLFPRSVSRH